MRMLNDSPDGRSLLLFHKIETRCSSTGFALVLESTWFFIWDEKCLKIIFSHKFSQFVQFFSFLTSTTKIYFHWELGLYFVHNALKYYIFEEIGSSVGREHNWDAGDCRFESHKIFPQLCRRICLLIQPLWEVNNGWICALVPRMRTLNGGPDGRRVAPCLVLWTLFEKSSVKTRRSFTSCPVSMGQVHGAVRGSLNLSDWSNGLVVVLISYSNRVLSGR